MVDHHRLRFIRPWSGRKGVLRGILGEFVSEVVIEIRTRHRGNDMGRSETFEHTADLGLRIFASDLPDLFHTAGEALFDVIVANRGDVQAVETELVSLTAESTEDLLIDWLNELIFRCETQHRLYTRFDVTFDENGRRLEATISGEPIDRGRHVLDHEVKAATRHDLSVRQVDRGWVAEVIVDI
jgi:SHS2 domain-containing protein